VYFLYAVDDVSSTVTFWPAEVTSVKPEVEMSLTVPIDPPAAGPDRALDPPLPAPRNAGGGVAALAAVGLLLDVALTIPYVPGDRSGREAGGDESGRVCGRTLQCSFDRVLPRCGHRLRAQ
jgi:hypothetical protein